MESLVTRLNVVQEQLMGIYEDGTETLQTQIQHWGLLRKEQVLLHAARQQGFNRVGLISVPPLSVTQQNAKRAIEMHLCVQSLALSAFANERWTLSDTSYELYRTPPVGTFKKQGDQVAVYFDGDKDNCMQYVKWMAIYSPDDRGRWHKQTSHCDHRGIYTVTMGKKDYYVEFSKDAEMYSSSGYWEVHDGPVIHLPVVPVTSSTPTSNPPRAVPVHIDGNPTDQTPLQGGEPARDVVDFRGGGELLEWSLPTSPRGTESSKHRPHRPPSPDSPSLVALQQDSKHPGWKRPGKPAKNTGHQLEPAGDTGRQSPGIRCESAQSGSGLPLRKRPRTESRQPETRPPQPPQPQQQEAAPSWPSPPIPILQPVSLTEAPVPPYRGLEGTGQAPGIDRTPSPLPLVAVSAAASPDQEPTEFPATTTAERGRGHRSSTPSTGSPVLLICKGTPNQVKCFRYKLKTVYRGLYMLATTTWNWVDGEGPGRRVGRSRMLILCESEEQRTRFLDSVTVPRGMVLVTCPAGLSL